MERLHVSRSRLASVENHVGYDTQDVSDKPNGFWWSVDRSWLDWCESNDFRIGGHVHALEIDETRILRISSVDDFDEFANRFDAPFSSQFSFLRGICWNHVASHYDGVEIAPYLWDRRHHDSSFWYGTWDCASGVTWRPDRVIKSIRYVEEWKQTAEQVEMGA